ncbi:MAG: transcription termination factor NusA [Phycisphaeraceae bacterium]
MNQDMLRIIDSIARDRNVDKDTLFYDIEQAMISAARKHFNAEDPEEFNCNVDRLTGEINVFHHGEKIPLESLGRIPAQTAKQVMIQKFREDERASIYDEFVGRVGELVTGTAQRYEGGALVISLGRAEGFMPRSEQIPGEQHAPGERIRCLILDVRDEGNQVKIVMTRAHQEFIRRLFEVEVPEVSERIIEIKALAREPGHRTKVAVSSIDSKVDAVGACVGVRGSRIKNIVDELGGEKIDVVRWNESSQVLIANALRPAEIVEISLCFELGRATVVVNEDQLSLAIGKRGQNVRLAARLTGWDVDILTPEEFAKGLDIIDETLGPIEGINEGVIDRMAALGFITVFDIEEVGPEVLVEHLGDFGMTHELAERIVEICSEKAKVVAEQQQREREEAAQRRAEEGVSGGDAADQQAAAILGNLGPAASAAAKPQQPKESGNIMDMLLNRPNETPSDEPASEPAPAADVENKAEVNAESHPGEEPEPNEQQQTPGSEEESERSSDEALAAQRQESESAGESEGEDEEASRRETPDSTG